MGNSIDNSSISVSSIMLIIQWPNLNDKLLFWLSALQQSVYAHLGLVLISAFIFFVFYLCLWCLYQDNILFQEHCNASMTCDCESHLEMHKISTINLMLGCTWPYFPFSFWLPLKSDVTYQQRLHRAATTIQAIWKGFLQRRKLKKANRGLATLQRSYRLVVYGLWWFWFQS